MTTALIRPWSGLTSRLTTSSTLAFEEMSSPVGLTAHASSFDRRHVIQHLVDHLPPGPPAEWFEATADCYLDRVEVVALGPDPVKGECYSTVDLLALERRLADQVAVRRLGERSPEVMPSIVWSVFQERPSLSGEQRDLIGDVCRSTDAVSVVVAGPGTGKTFCLDSIRDTFQRSGYTTIGCALSASAAHELEQGSGIESMTIARLRLQLDQRERKLRAAQRARDRRSGHGRHPGPRAAARPRSDSGSEGDPRR